MRITRIFVLAAVFGLLAFAAAGQDGKKPAKVTYDAKLAKRLGGNDNAMKSYVIVFLKTGPKDAEIKGKERDDTFAGHMANIGRLAETGKLLVAGPFGKNDLTFRGLFIFDTTDIEEARKLVETDPAVKAGIFVYDIMPWFGSAAVAAIPEIHQKITKPKK